MFIDGLQKLHRKMVGFMPRAQLVANIEKGRVLVAESVVGADGAATPPTRVGYIIASDKYLKREELGIVYQLNVVPGRQRTLVGASLLQAAFQRAAYGCRLFCCWCAQDLEANRFWESVGFVPIAFRAGARAKAVGGRGEGRGGRIHIFWQRRVRAGDTQTPYWFPSETHNGALREARIVLPMPPGTHWSDAKPAIFPGVVAVAREGAGAELGTRTRTGTGTSTVAIAADVNVNNAGNALSITKENQAMSIQRNLGRPAYIPVPGSELAPAPASAPASAPVVSSRGRKKKAAAAAGPAKEKPRHGLWFTPEVAAKIAAMNAAATKAAREAAAAAKQAETATGAAPAAKPGAPAVTAGAAAVATGKPRHGLWFTPEVAAKIAAMNAAAAAGSKPHEGGNAATAIEPKPGAAAAAGATGVPKLRNDPKLVAAARELRDRYIERINADDEVPGEGAAGAESLSVSPSASASAAKYDVSRQLEEAPSTITPTPLLKAA